MAQPMIVGVPKETFPEERRVALVPTVVPMLAKAGIEVLIEPGAGEAAGFSDASFAEKGARIAPSRPEVFAQARIIVQVRACGANLVAGRDDLGALRRGQTLIGLCHPFSAADTARRLAECGVMLFSLELMPRITRAQAMDVLSSMSTIAGYKAVVIAADALTRMFPMLVTAAGTVIAARVFVIGAGVAGLQAIASARRLGAIVEAYDVRPAVREQVESLGAKFVEFKLETAEAEDQGGYAKALGEEFYRRQREMMAQVVAANDVVIATAVVPGKPAPVLITRAMVEGMAPGSAIVDLAAEQGGNCELTRPGLSIQHRGVTIVGPINIASTVPFHASQMYARNMTAFLRHLVRDGEVNLDPTDEIVAATLVTRDGEIVQPKVKEFLASLKQEQ
ncbi:MAG: Re/Si-specific NAD(P)(+) transhydrogenase subunit alpha [Candidatus Eisenbacteria bacterium]